MISKNDLKEDSVLAALISPSRSFHIWDWKGPVTFSLMEGWPGMWYRCTLEEKPAKVLSSFSLSVCIFVSHLLLCSIRSWTVFISAAVSTFAASPRRGTRRVTLERRWGATSPPSEQRAPSATRLSPREPPEASRLSPSSPRSNTWMSSTRSTPTGEKQWLRGDLLKWTQSQPKCLMSFLSRSVCPCLASISRCRSHIRTACSRWCPPCRCTTCTSCCQSPSIDSSMSAPTSLRSKTCRVSPVSQQHKLLNNSRRLTCSM